MYSPVPSTAPQAPVACAANAAVLQVLRNPCHDATSPSGALLHVSCGDGFRSHVRIELEPIILGPLDAGIACAFQTCVVQIPAARLGALAQRDDGGLDA